jgi:hypothetical protein
MLKAHNKVPRLPVILPYHEAQQQEIWTQEELKDRGLIMYRLSSSRCFESSTIVAKTGPVIRPG